MELLSGNRTVMQKNLLQGRMKINRQQISHTPLHSMVRHYLQSDCTEKKRREKRNKTKQHKKNRSESFHKDECLNKGRGHKGSL